MSSLLGASAALRRGLAEVASLLVPLACAGCAVPGPGLCRGCAGELSRARPVHEPGAPPAWAGMRYTETNAEAVLAFKNHGRTDLARALAEVLGRALETARAQAGLGPGVPLVLAPTRRAAYARRGYRPVPLLLARLGERETRLLRWGRQPRDQLEVGRARRHENLRGSMRVAGSPALRSAAARSGVLFVDDVWTSGSTAREARRALAAEGIAVHGAVLLAWAG